MKKYLLSPKSGNISIMLVMIIILLSVLTTAAVALAISTTRDTTTFTMGEKVHSIAESGAENAILRLLRDPSYTGETNLPIGAGNATITVTGTSPYTILSIGTIGSITRNIEVKATITAGKLTVISWQEL